MRNLILCVLCFIALFACSGHDKITVDDTPPITPELIPHIGDLWDPANPDYQNIIPTDDNNGIDAVPDGDWIKISWNHFLDTDIDYVKIYRFDNNPNDVIHPTTMIDSIQYDPLKDYYIDSKAPLQTNIHYSYFIKVVDEAGNSSTSNTVTYSLLSKQILVSPQINSVVNPTNVSFNWQKSGIVTKYRILVFDENHENLWAQDVPVTDEGDYFNAIWPNYPQQYTGSYIYWRVDAFEWDSDLGIFIGSESNENIVYLSSEKK